MGAAGVNCQLLEAQFELNMLQVNVSGDNVLWQSSRSRGLTGWLFKKVNIIKSKALRILFAPTCARVPLRKAK